MLIEPDPLYFREDTKQADKDLFVVNLLQKPEFKEGLTYTEITTHLGISVTHFYNSIKKPLAEGIVIKLDDKRPVRYKFNHDKFGD